MARIYARRRGRSSSKRPFSMRLKQVAPDWVELSSEEIESKVVELRNQGLSSSEIGIRLRDSLSVPSVPLVTGKKIMSILKEQERASKLPEDIQNLMRKALRIRKHLDVNKRDIHNKRALQLTESKIRRLAKYYRRANVLPEDWKYKPETAEVLMRG
ncbi:MAG TPA: 30S ribosomal protein S15 [Methanomicrobia archaeon]|nr:30S ribosomal protein S15 [Methanomicrobia archaeon]